MEEALYVEQEGTESFGHGNGVIIFRAEGAQPAMERPNVKEVSEHGFDVDIVWDAFLPVIAVPYCTICLCAMGVHILTKCKEG